MTPPPCEGLCRGVWYDLFMMLDIFSRYCPGWMVIEGHDAEVVRDWIEAIVASQGPFEPGRSLHPCRPRQRDDLEAGVAAARGPAHRGAPHGRPHVSNDNPYSEAGFKTLKYAPNLPGPLRQPRRRSRLHGPVHRLLQPPAPPLGHRLPHAGLGPLRHRRARVGGTGLGRSMPPTRPTPSASSTSHRSCWTCLARPGSTSRRRRWRTEHRVTPASHRA